MYSPQVLSTLTKDLGKVVAAMHATQISGSADVTSGINVASLALKHRQDKNQRQRIIVFNGSPIADSEEGLVKLAKRLKKNNVAVDIVSFGEDEENSSKLRSFVDAVNSGENSHLLTIPAGPRLLSDIILDSPILMGEAGDGAGPSGSGGDGAGGGEGGRGGFEFGVDPSMDPELAMALRMSLEEEQARQRASEGASSGAQETPVLDTVFEGQPASSNTADVPPHTSTATTTPAPASSAQLQAQAQAVASTSSGSALAQVEPAPGGFLPSTGSLILPGADPLAGTGAAAVDDSEDAMLQQALALSQQQQHSKVAAADEDIEMTTGQAGAGAGAAAVDEDEDMDEEEAIARAIEMSLKKGGDEDKK